MFSSSYLSLFLICIILNSVHLAPVEEKSLLDIIRNDTRVEQLKSNKIIKAECKRKDEFSDSLCFAIYDLSLQFQEAKLSFADTKNDEVKDICSKLDKILPEKPKIDEATLANIKKNYPPNIQWIKDILKQKEGKRCEEDCMYTDFDDDYAMKVKPACLFIYNQYQFLASQSTKEQEEKKSKSAEEIKSSENNERSDVKSSTLEGVKAAEEAAKAIIPIFPANLVVEPPKTQNETQPKAQLQQPEPKVVPEPEKEEKKEEKPITTAAVVASNKSETAQAKAETTKTESTVNAIDLDQQNSENSPDDQDVFNNAETQTELPEKDFDINPDEGPDEYNLDDADNTDMVRDNNHNMNNKFNHLPSVEIDQHESERVRVEKVLDEFEDNPDSNFFTYLCIVMFLSILLYILYHNRHKILALLLEGRRGSRRSRERSRGGSKAAYSKLDCNLEEAITSKKSLSGKSMDIIY